ncbi:MAG: hypothetical protein LW822_02745 [Phycisphaeraceae bacterium]|nr:hypothetical protein [Phycisphaeraceae bacterium]
MSAPHLPQPVLDAAAAVLKRPGKFYRRFRRTVRVCFVLLCLLPAVILILTQGPVPRYLLKRAISQATGGEFTSTWVSLKLNGQLIIDNPQLRVPTIPGDPGRLFNADAIVVDLDWSAWAAGVVAPRGVTLKRPVVRVAIDTTNNTMNIAALGIPAGGTGQMRVPRIQIEAGQIILGEFAAQNLTTLASLNAHGWISPLPQPDQYMLTLRAEDPLGGNTPITVNGTLDLARAEGVIDAGSLQLARWGPERVPSIMRDVWEILRLRGQIARMQLRFGRVLGVQTTLTLNDVSLNVPVPAGRREITGSRNPRMDGVTGTLCITTAGPGKGLQADLTGSFEDLPARVRINSQGLDLNSAYQATITAEHLKLEKDPRILWFAPAIVLANFERFSGPTAVIDARIQINRPRPETNGTPADTSIGGTIIFRQGVAAFDQFPYTISDLAGAITFDEDKVSILGITGRGPTGARLFAEGTLAPPTSDARLEINVTCTDVPMDDYLIDAIKRSKAAALADAIFSKPIYNRLLNEGLIRNQEATERYTQELHSLDAQLTASDQPPDGNALTRRADLARRLAAPAIDFGGTIDAISVRIRSDFGLEQPTRQEILVGFAGATIISKFFPLPARADHLALRITDTAAEIKGNGLQGPEGGLIDLDARVDIRREPSTGQWTYDPNVAASFHALPVSPLLIQAIPHKAGPQQTNADPRLLLSAMNISGPIDATLTLTTPPDGPTSTLVNLSFNNLTSQPQHHHQATGTPAKLTNIAGQVAITDDRITFNQLTGIFVPATDQPPATPSTITLRPGNNWWIGKGRPPVAGRLDFTLRDIETSLALEHIIRPFSDGTADAISKIRKPRQPAGRIDADISIAQEDDANPQGSVRARIFNPQSLSALADNIRIDTSNALGSILVQAPICGPEPVRIDLQNLRADIRLNGQPLATAQLTGTVALAVEPTPDNPGTPQRVIEPVNLLLRDARFESPLVKELLTHYAPPRVADFYARAAPAGDFDAEVSITPRPNATGNQTSIALRPRQLSLTLDDKRYQLPTISGEVTLQDLNAGQPPAGLIDQLTIVGDNWQLTTVGTWSAGGNAPGDPSWQASTTLTLETTGLPPSLASILPPAIENLITKSNITTDDPITTQALTLELNQPDTGNLNWSLAGRIDFTRLNLDRGLKITNATGNATLKLHSAPTGPAGTIRIAAARARIQGLLLAGIDADLTLGLPNTTLRIDNASAWAYGGRVHAQANLGIDPQTTTDGRTYQIWLTAAGLSFLDLRAELLRTGANPSPSPPDNTADDTPNDTADARPNYTRGTLTLDLSLSGTPDQPSALIGRGSATVAGGSTIINLPIVVGLMQISNLNLPTDEQFDFAATDFHIQGQTIGVDHAVLLSPSLAMIGTGTIALPDGNLSLSFNSRSRVRLPLLTAIFEGFRDEIVTTSITGTINDLRFTINPLRSTRRFMATLVGAHDSNPLIPTLDLRRYENQRDAAIARRQQAITTHPLSPEP